MRLTLAPGLSIEKSAIEGKGCFSVRQFQRGRKIAEYTGERISNAEANRRAGRRKLRICAINNRWSLDGSRGGKYEDNYYRYLNLGLKMPISTGTDWFIYDFSRVYARVAGKLTVKSWLNAVKDGRTVATNGPLLSLKVDGREIGDVIDLKSPKTLHVEASGLGRHNFQRLQLVHNGKVITTRDTYRKNGFFAAVLSRDLRIDDGAYVGGEQRQAKTRTTTR